MTLVFSGPLPAAELEADHKWWEIYEASFPIEEREPASVIYRSIEAGPGVALRIRQDRVTTGIATLHRLQEVPLAFCVYLAIAAQARGSGLGSSFFRHVANTAGPGGMVWEVEDPARARNSDEERQRVRRIQFFERAGGQLLDAPYCQPPLNGHEPVPMRLLWRAGASDAPLPDAARLIRAIYFEKYGAINGIDGEVLERLLATDPGSSGGRAFCG